MHPHSEADKRLGVRIHAMALVATLLVLIGINVWTGPPYWVAWVVPGWAIGLLCHWYFILGRKARRA